MRLYAIKMYIYNVLQDATSCDKNVYLQRTTVRCRYTFLSHEVAPGSDITPCNKIDKPLVVYGFRNVTKKMTKSWYFHAKKEFLINFTVVW